MKRPNDVLDFWFGPLKGPLDFPAEKSSIWFRKSETVDKKIRDEFFDTWKQASNGKLEQWAGDTESRLALIIVLDQFSRNLHRDNATAFSCDAKALKLAQDTVRRKEERILFPIQKVFLYLPFEHSEDIDMQKTAVSLFTALLEEVPDQMKSAIREFLRYAQAHYDIIEKFGRFPHRNQVLGRESTPEEKEFLKKPGSSF